MDQHAKYAGPVEATGPIHPFSATCPPTTPADVSIAPDSRFVALPPTAHNFPGQILPDKVPLLARTPGHTLQLGVPAARFHLARLIGQTPRYRCDRKVQDLAGSRRPGKGRSFASAAGC